MIGQGFVLLLVGMLVVFAFLILLVCCMNLAATFFKKYARWFPEEEKTTPGKIISTDDADIAVAVAAVKNFMK